MISLKSFHLFFIFMSIILSIWFAVYEFQLSESSKLFAFLSLAVSVGLCFYGIKVYKKFKAL